MPQVMPVCFLETTKAGELMKISQEASPVVRRPITVADDITIVLKVWYKLSLPFVPGSFYEQLVDYPVRGGNASHTIWSFGLHPLRHEIPRSPVFYVTAKLSTNIYRI